MKKIPISVALLLLSGCDGAQAGADFSQPYDATEAVARDRFEVVSMSGFIDKIITDGKTGCQYMVVGNTGNPTLLGCFEEYKK